MPKKLEPKILLAVRCIVLNDNGETLLLKRSSKRQYNPEKWELPGGILGHGENIEDAVERQVNSETNVIVDPIPGSYFCHSRLVLDEGKYKDHTYVEISMAGNYVAGEVKITEEHTEFKWVPASRALEFDLSLESKKAIVNYVREIRFPLKPYGPQKVPVLLVARALIKNEKNQYLLLKRAREDVYQGQWELPGGKLNNLETLGTHLKREVFEETGLVIEIIEPSIHIYSNIANKGKYVGYTYINITNEAEIISGDVKLNQREHEKFGWFSKEEIFKLDIADYMKLPLTEILMRK